MLQVDRVQFKSARQVCPVLHPGVGECTAGLLRGILTRGARLATCPPPPVSAQAPSAGTSGPLIWPLVRPYAHRPGFAVARQGACEL